MRTTRRTAIKGGLTVAAAALTTVGMKGAAAREPAITVPGEAPTRTNIPIASDPRATSGRYLALATTAAPPGQGWYAAYTVNVRTPGPHRLVATATVPVEQPQLAEVGSYFALSVNGAPFTPLPGSQPRWYESTPAWGDLSRLKLGDVDLRRGANTITFRVTEPASVGYRFLLDEFTLAPTPLALAGVHLGDPAENVGIYRAGDASDLWFRLNGQASRALTARYAITDYFGLAAGSGAVAIRAGAARAKVRLPELPPGNYQVRATLDGTPGTVVGYFARLPEQRPVTGSANRFGVNVFAFSLVPPARLDAFAAAMREMGAGYVRDGNAWPEAEPVPGRYDTSRYDQLTRTYHRHGLRTLEVISAAPEWAMDDTSVPLPADLRHAYRYARQLAAHGSDVTSRALQLSNEPDVDETASTGDQHAAYVKAAALGIASTPSPPLTVLPGIAGTGQFQDLMLQNGVVRYADVWAFHGYPDPAEPEDPEFPPSAEDQHALRRLHGAGTAMWMTECGAFLPSVPGRDLTAANQVVQARYLVRSTVEGLAAGNDRQFWFVGPPCSDDGVAFGLFSREFQPWPAYSAHAAMTALLKGATFVAAVPLRDAVGYTFDSGGRAVTVVWAAKSAQVDVPVPGTVATVHDIMGVRRRKAAVSPGGTVRVRASADPI